MCLIIKIAAVIRKSVECKWISKAKKSKKKTNKQSSKQNKTNEFHVRQHS